jgi:hypothetical protein
LAVFAALVIVTLGLLLGRTLAAEGGQQPLGPAVVITPGADTSPTVAPTREPRQSRSPSETGARSVPRPVPCAGDDDSEPDDDAPDADDACD